MGKMVSKEGWLICITDWTIAALDTPNGFLQLYTVKKIEIVGKAKIIGSASDLFSELPYLVEISGLNNLDFSEVTSMYATFGYCPVLEKIDLEYLDTSNVTDMSYLFQDDYSLRNINIANFDMRNVVNFSGMFSYCKSLQKLDIR